MSTVILAGAGASLAEAMPAHPPRDRRPPLDATFFELCRLASLPGRQSIQKYMFENFGINPFIGNRRMEEIFNFIYSDAFSADPPVGCIDAYWALIQMYIQAIGRTTNHLDGRSRSGIGALLRHLWSERNELPTIVTFNQDLVIENAIESSVAMAKYSDLPWNIQHCYGIPFTGYPTITPNSKPFRSSGDSSIRVLKLHGSANWHYSVRSGGDPKNGVRSAQGKLRCLNDQRVVPRVRFKGSRRPVHTIPLIVPPIYEKSARYRDAVGPIWTAASGALESATKLIIFGYSFPPTDFGARSLLRRAFHRNTALQEVQIIDIDPSVASRVAELLSPPCVHLFKDVPTFQASDR
jgi:hypothetical protein